MVAWYWIPISVSAGMIFGFLVASLAWASSQEPPTHSVLHARNDQQVR